MQRKKGKKILLVLGIPAMVLVKVIKLIIDINRGLHFILNLRNLQQIIFIKVAT